MIINHQDKNKNVTDHDISTESDDKVVVDTATPEDVGDEPEQEVVSEQLIGSEGLDNVDADREEAIDDDVLPSYEELQTELAAAKDQLLRSLAEGENIRRRAERDKIESSKYAITNFARQIITVADNLTRALGSVSEEARGDNEELNNFFIGIEMTDKELMNSFEQANIKVVNSIGQKFDHNVHQAMFEVDDREQPAGMVVQEIQKGYLLHDRLLRPAMVGVSKGGPNLIQRKKRCKWQMPR